MTVTQVCFEKQNERQSEARAYCLSSSAEQLNYFDTWASEVVVAILTPLSRKLEKVIGKVWIEVNESCHFPTNRFDRVWVLELLCVFGETWWKDDRFRWVEWRGVALKR